MRANLFAVLCCAATAACAGGLDDRPLTFTVEGDRLIAVGEIDGGSLDAFAKIVDAYPEIRTLVLRHIGGSVDDAANVVFAREVRRLGFTTVVPSGGLVASGGTDLFLAGVTRILEPGACVGVHSWAADDFTATDVPRNSVEHGRYLDYYDDMGIARAFYWFTIEAAPAEDMHWMTAQEAGQFGLATEPVHGLATSATCDSR